jgi:multidrug efflux pump subunit AcrA (membrane-fusion protein)
MQNASNNVELTSLELNNAQKNYDQVKKLYELGASSQNELSQAESALKKAQISYDNAKASLENIKNKNTGSAKNNIEIQKVTLEKQNKMLSDAKIVAPIDGTITMVNAKENGSAAGLLFVIEDTDNLIVSTAIGEYDIGLINIGQEVAIKTDGTGDKQFAGTISQIAPTAAKDAGGNTAASSNVQFDTEIKINDKDPVIKIGMNVRLTIKLSEKKDVYSVPYDAVVTEADGSKSIYVLEAAQNSRRIQVETGMETDIYVEISSPELKDGMNVLTNPNGSADATK